jgi:hypothetical protein
MGSGHLGLLFRAAAKGKVLLIGKAFRHRAVVALLIRIRPLFRLCWAARWNKKLPRECPKLCLLRHFCVSISFLSADEGLTDGLRKDGLQQLLSDLFALYSRCGNVITFLAHVRL